MTVSQFISLLQTYDPNLVVRVTLDTAQADLKPKDHLRVLSNLLVIG